MKLVKDSEKTLVSVCCITFNQEKLIKKALDSFVMQETDFKFEVLINDDKSTDRTPLIVQEYAKKYPDIIKPVLNEKNLGPLKNFFTNFGRAKGKYIALCEGDDYWTDPKKLQKQVDFMEKNPDYAICFHPVEIKHEDKKIPEKIFPSETSGFTLDALLSHNFIQTNSVMYRRQNPYNLSKEDFLPGDWYLHIYHAKCGKIGFINEVMAVYYRHPGGLWSDSTTNRRRFWNKQAFPHMKLFEVVGKIFPNNKKRQEIIKKTAANVLNSMASDVEEFGNFLVKQKIFEKYPEFVIEYINLSIEVNRKAEADLRKGQKEVVEEKDNLIAELNEIIAKQNDIITTKNSIITARDKTITNIANSNSYKVGQKITGPYRYLNNVLKRK